MFFPLFMAVLPATTWQNAACRREAGSGLCSLNRAARITIETAENCS